MDESAPSQTDALLARIANAADRLNLFPRMGRQLAVRTDVELRQIMCDSYRIVYEVEGESVTIATVYHSSMDVETRLRQLLEDN